MTIDGLVFFCMCGTMVFLLTKKMMTRLSGLGGRTIVGIQMRLEQAGYALILGEHEIPVQFAVQGRLVPQILKIDGPLEKDDKRFVLKVERPSEIVVRTDQAWNEQWGQVKALYPDASGIVYLNQKSGRIMKVQVE